MVKPGYKVVFRLGNLFSYGTEVYRVPVRCWRFTATLQPNLNGRFSVDGVDFTDDLTADPSVGDFVNTFQIRLGGVCDTNGNPVLIDQELLITPKGAPATGVLVWEDLVKI